MVFNRASNQFIIFILNRTNFDYAPFYAIKQLIINTRSIYNEMLQIAVFYSE
jgi:hypothetical protein